MATPTVIILTGAGAGTWTVPPGCVSAQVELIGAGSSGWIATNNNGGAGGDYAKLNAIALTPGDVVPLHYGTGGAATTAAAPNVGEDTWFNSTATVLARGGGSLTPASIGDVIHAGGAVALSGGGGAGGPTGPGSASTSTTGGGGDAGSGLGGAGGAASTNGGNGTEWGTAGSGGGGGGSIANNGGNGGNYGGGGGGARSGHTAGAGANGIIVITYTPTDEAAAAQTLEDSAQAAAAQLTDTASAAQTLDDVSPAATASSTGMGNEVDVAQTLDDVTQSATAQQADPAAAAQTLGDSAQSATATDTPPPGNIYADVQKLEPGALVDVFDFDATQIGGDLLRFHGYTQVGSIWWQGNEYKPWPIQLQGMERTSAQPPTPTLTVANIDGSISAACLAFDDLVGATLTVHRTFGQYLDAANFGGVNPTADPTQEIPPEIWTVERKAGEDNVAVQFELSGGWNFAGKQLPGRPIIANVCAWLAIGGYRGAYCGYAGPPVAQSDDTPTSDPSLDKCGGRVTSCKLRFGADPTGLPYGSFPAAGLLRT